MTWRVTGILFITAVLVVLGCDRKTGSVGQEDGEWTPLRMVKQPVGYLEWAKQQLDAGIAAKEALRKSIGQRVGDLSAKRSALLREVSDADDRQTLQRLYDDTVQQAQAAVAKLGEDLGKHQRSRQKLVVQLEQVRLNPEMPDLWQIVVPISLELERMQQDLTALRFEAKQLETVEPAPQVAGGGGQAPPAGRPPTVVPVVQGGDVRQAMGVAERLVAEQRLDEAWATFVQVEKMRPGLWQVREGMRQVAEAMYQRGLRMEFGHGYNRNPAGAVEWYRKAADGGNVLAQYKMGLMSQNSNPADGAAAFGWYSKAAQQGLAKAQNNLGAMLCEGRLVRRDLPEGLNWLRRAAQQGNQSAQKNLRQMGQRW